MTPPQSAPPSESNCSIDMDFSRLATPTEHGAALVEPAPSSLRALVSHNRALLGSYDFALQNVSVGEARRMLRSAVGVGDSEGPLVVTGHQPDFIHAGVWAKHVVAVRLAKALGGRAVNLVVDHDAPKQAALVVPDLRGGRIATRTVSYADWPHGAAFEGMPVMDAVASRRFAEEVRQALGPIEGASLLKVFFDAYRFDAYRDSTDVTDATDVRDWVDQAVSARRAVERSFDVEIADFRVNALWCGPLLGEMFANAERFASAYNRALATYRRRHRVRGTDRPVPDLHRDAERCEVAVWAYRLGSPRRRVFVQRRGGDGLVLFAGAERIGDLDDASVRSWHKLCGSLGAMSPWVIRPRALTLTLWARLLLADVFIHGIGGAKYDQVTNELVREYFKVEPPKMACVSATLRLDLPRHDLPAGAVRRARFQLRDLAFNPDRYVDALAMSETLAERADAIREGMRLRSEDGGNRVGRRRVFQRIRELNRRVAEAAPGVRRSFESRLEGLVRLEAENAVAMSREYFFAMHARDDLELMLGNLPDVRDFG